MVGEISSHATEGKSAEQQGKSWTIFRENLPIDFTISSNDKEKNTSRFAISANGMCFEIFKFT